MANQVESPQWQKETIRLDQPFQLFDPRRTEEKVNQEEIFPAPVKEYRSVITLQTGGKLPLFPIRIITQASVSRKGNMITPFNPDLGYQITDDDLQLESRVNKIKAMQNELLQKVDYSAVPLYLGLRTSDEEFLNVGIGRKEEFSWGDRIAVKDEYIDLLEKLRLQLQFPGNTYESRTWYGWFSFHAFYPFEKGPLARPPVGEIGSGLPFFLNTLSEGLGIHLPSDKHTLEQIKAKFYFDH